MYLQYILSQGRSHGGGGTGGGTPPHRMATQKEVRARREMKEKENNARFR